MKATVTGYWPYHPTSGGSNARVEGGTTDRRGRQIHTLEAHMLDPVAHPYVTVAGDYTIWPDGQRLEFEQWPGIIFRVTDTGGSFYGPRKRYRVTGQEPLDVAVDTAATVIDRNQEVTIVDGDSFEGANGTVNFVKLENYGIDPFNTGPDLFDDMPLFTDGDSASIVRDNMPLVGALILAGIVIALANKFG